MASRFLEPAQFEEQMAKKGIGRIIVGYHSREPAADLAVIKTVFPGVDVIKREISNSSGYVNGTLILSGMNERSLRDAYRTMFERGFMSSISLTKSKGELVPYEHANDRSYWGTINLHKIEWSRKDPLSPLMEGLQALRHGLHRLEDKLALYM